MLGIGGVSWMRVILPHASLDRSGIASICMFMALSRLVGFMVLLESFLSSTVVHPFMGGLHASVILLWPWRSSRDDVHVLLVALGGICMVFVVVIGTVIVIGVTCVIMGMLRFGLRAG